MAAIDRRTMDEFGVPGLVLMENAGRSVAYAIAERWRPDNRVLVLCGPGNNGGDGYCVARTLLNIGYRVRCLSSCAEEKYGPDALCQRRAWLLAGGMIESWEQLRECLGECELVVDGLFGTGLQRDIGGVYAQLVDEVNASGKPVVAIDIPSGVACDTGRCLGTAFKCRLTVTMGLPKPGLFLFPGCELAGERVVAELGFSRRLLEDVAEEGEILTRDKVRSWLPSPHRDAHKGSKGCALIIGGSTLYYGAPLLAAEAALRAGCGLCVWAAPSDLLQPRPLHYRELIVWPMDKAPDCLDMRAWPELQGGLSQQRGGESGRPLPHISALCIGPGLGREPGSAALLAQVLADAQVPVVVDADGLRLLQARPLPGQVVLTPHRGELAALMNCSLEEVAQAPLDTALRCAELYQSVVVMKGAPTVVAFRGHYWLNDVADPVLAVGGSGDVLAGIIAGLLAQGLEPWRAACAGVSVHSWAGLRAAESVGPQGVLAGEFAARVPGVLAELEREKPVKTIAPRLGL